MQTARRPCNWQLKGQGAANLVFTYCGDDPQLRGHVLRVRKSSAQVGSDIDRLLWDGVLDTAHGCNITYEMEYMTYVIAPLLGPEYVFAGIPIPVPEELRDILGPDTWGSTSLPALVQPDHTTFHSKVAPGYVGVGPAICLEIKPKWGLDPREVDGRQRHHPHDESTAPGSPGSVGGPTPPTEPKSGSQKNVSSDLGPGGVDSGSASNGLDDVRRRYPRFMLHMLYKHVKKGVPISLYNPLDLFSGDPLRIDAALWALFKCPSNNLSVFKDGVKLYGAGPKAGRSDSFVGKGSPSAQQQQQLLEDHQQRLKRETAALAQLAVSLEGFVDADVRSSGNGAGPAAPSSPSVEAADATGRAAIQPSTDGNQMQQQQQRTQHQQPQGSMEVVGTLVRVAARALQQEKGLLEHLQHMQALDNLGAEGALKLYDQLVHELKIEPGLSQELARKGSATEPKAATASVAGDAAGDGPESPLDNEDADPDTVRRASAADLACGLSSPAGRVPSSSDSRRMELRRYLISATAKDCGIMVTLQRAVRVPEQELDLVPEAPVEGAAGQQGATVVAAAGQEAVPAPLTLQPLRLQEAAAGQAPSKQEAAASQRPPVEPVVVPLATALPALGVAQEPWVRIVEDPETGLVYMYKVAVVDLDVKASSKIPKHVELERSMLECAAANLGALQDIAQEAGWASTV